jgi:hypothetical protein
MGSSRWLMKGRWVRSVHVTFERRLSWSWRMARPLRINRTGAWHHVMSRANEVIPFSAATSIGAGSLGFLVEGVPGRVARAGLGLILANSDGTAAQPTAGRGGRCRSGRLDPMTVGRRDCRIGRTRDP